MTSQNKTGIRYHCRTHIAVKYKLISSMHSICNIIKSMKVW